MKKENALRIRVLSGIVILIFLVYVMKLVQYQIIEGQEHYESSSTAVVFNQTLTSSRGDIVDSYGTPLASSRVVFNVILNRAYLDSEFLNDRIKQVVEILEQNGESVNDILPLSYSYPYSFSEDKESEISWVRQVYGLNVYATEQDVMEKIIEKYSLEDYPQQWQRKIGGIRYTMERDGYTLSQPFVIAEDVSEKTVSVISEKSHDLLGVEIYNTSERYYEDGTLMPHILGNVGPIYAEEYSQLKEQGYKMNDILGKAGLEKAYENYLKGKDGAVQIVRDMYGEIMGKSVKVRPEEGDTLQLTIDYQLQDALNDILENQINNLHATEWGEEASGISAVVIDIKTGGILAIANYPNYDLNLYSSNYSEYASDENNPLFNRALQGLYRPGSVFKCAVAIAAIQEGIIDENTEITCTGTYMYYAPSYMPGCANGAVHGTLNVKQALQVSCNNFFYEVGRQLGIEKMNEIAHQCGLGVKTGIELSEQTGVISSPEYTESLGGTWQAGNTIQTAIGQMDTVITTVQLATYAATLGNDGKRLNTHIVDSIISVDGDVVYKTPIETLSQIQNTNNAFGIVEEGMVMASSQGAASRFLIGLPYQIASKTGTAQVPGGYLNATMMAYGPTDNPEIAIGIVAEKGGNGYYLAESVRDIFEEYYYLKEIRKNENWQEIWLQYKQEKEQQKALEQEQKELEQSQTENSQVQAE